DTEHNFKKSTITKKNNNKNNLTNSKKNIIKNKTRNQSTIESNNTEVKPIIDPTLVENVILEVRKNPRISLWSAKSAAVLRLLKKTKPEFSISKEASSLIEEAVKDKYPDLWDEFEDREI
ncbi:MAG: AAA family ATPase, partial [Methanobacterium sp.]|uniref:AAA family ATPase n=1 Tax=Methanobacterium sp. TaxID=2164 RepID=UPI003C76A3AB